MIIPPPIENLVRGLVLHFLQQKTIDQAIIEGCEAGMPEELLDSLPGMVFQATAAAGAVHIGERTMSQVLKVMVKRGAPKENAECLIKFALDVIGELETEVGSDNPVPTSDRKWFECAGLLEGTEKGTG